jgi:hypothetical protein
VLDFVLSRFIAVEDGNAHIDRSIPRSCGINADGAACYSKDPTARSNRSRTHLVGNACSREPIVHSVWRGQSFGGNFQAPNLATFEDGAILDVLVEPAVNRYAGQTCNRNTRQSGDRKTVRSRTYWGEIQNFAGGEGAVDGGEGDVDRAGGEDEVLTGGGSDGGRHRSRRNGGRFSEGGANGNQARLCSSAGAAAVCVASDSLARRRGQCSLDVPHHHALHHPILVNVEMTDIRHTLQVNILQHAAELRALVDGITHSIRDVVIYVAVDVSRRDHARCRIQAYCQFDGDTEFAKACSHARNCNRPRRVAD